MQSHIAELTRKSINSDIDAQICLVFKLYYDLEKKQEAFELCRDFKHENPLLHAMYLYFLYKTCDANNHCKSLLVEAIFGLFNLMAKKKEVDTTTHYALNMIGVFYTKGIGVKQNKFMGQAYYEKSARHGNEYAMCNLSRLDNIDQALKISYLEKSAACYSMCSINDLVEIYCNQSQTLNKACKYYVQSINLVPEITHKLYTQVNKQYELWQTSHALFFPAIELNAYVPINDHKCQLLDKYVFRCDNQQCRVITKYYLLQQQIFVCLCISKFREKSTFGAIKIFCKSVAMLVCSHLYHINMQTP